MSLESPPTLKKKFLIASRSTLINPSHFQFETGQLSVCLGAYYKARKAREQVRYGQISGVLSLKEAPVLLSY